MAGVPRDSVGHLGRLILVGVAYYASARLGLRLALVGHIVTPLWPPTGVAVVAFCVLGFSVWPAIALAAFAVNIAAADTPVIAAAISVGNTLAPLVAAKLLRRFGFSSELNRLRDALVLVAVALVTMTISASGGTAAVVLGGASVGVLDTWWVWWTGDAMGVLIVAPVLWAAGRLRRTRLNPLRTTEAGVLFLTLAAACVAATTTANGFLFVVLPVLGWIAWRFHLAGAAPAGFVASGIVIFAAANDWGIFAGMPLLRRMVLLQLFNASVALTCAVFAAAVTERRQILESLYEHEHDIAQTLQRSLLPELPAREDVLIAARYTPAQGASEVGGDWYDVIPLAGGKLGLVVGDVVGHGIGAASAMTQLRVGLRAYALMGNGPAATLRALNRMAVDLQAATMATVLYAELDPRHGELRFANAGHMSPLLVTAAHEARYLETDLAVPIGVAAELECEDRIHDLSDGSTIILFTDGLIERRDVSIDESLEHLRKLSAVDGADLEELCDRILAEVAAAEAIDDVALLVVRPTGSVGAMSGGRGALPPAGTDRD